MVAIAKIPAPLCGGTGVYVTGDLVGRRTNRREMKPPFVVRTLIVVVGFLFKLFFN